MTTFSGALASADQHRKANGIAVRSTTQLYSLEFKSNCGWFQFTFLGGLGVGFQEMITIIMAALVCDPEDIGLASGFLGSMKQVSGTIASKPPFTLKCEHGFVCECLYLSTYLPLAAIYVAILKNRLNDNLAPTVTSTALNAGISKSSIPALFKALEAGTADALQAVPGMTTQIAAIVEEAVQTVYSSAYRTVYLASIAFGGVAIIAAFSSRSIDDKMTAEVARKLRGVDVHDVKGDDVENSGEGNNNNPPK
jgi:trichothecene efflux pump TRI12